MPHDPGSSPVEPFRRPTRSGTPRRGAPGQPEPPASGVPDTGRLGLSGPAQARRTALLLPTDLPFPAWLRIGEQLHAVADSSAWWAGDWLVYGSKVFPDRYRRAIERTALDYQTLRNYAWVARKVDVARRRHDLSFQHHQEVAALTPEEQDHWLGEAAGHGWSKAELRRRMRAERAVDTMSGGGPKTRLHLEVEGHRWVRWQRAADCEGGDVAAWLCGLADRAALGEAV
ncbi:LmbU family transcriptional regulator [Streptomyces sp. NPDC058683]|uniref:LmbU family transcriptional regulator n=1 Tax=Streptomyces sp. NPDC058683 TaxID=3346597 RepID=UPI00364849CB